ncbi:MAG: HepT-like ribonuclease domain-containing protein, partial [Brasilonema sp.]
LQHPEVPWSQIIGMRNILTHNYFEIDLDVVWSAVERNLPNLKQQIETILQVLS